MRPEITPLETADESTVEAVLTLLTAAGAADVPDFPPPCPYAFRGDLRHPVSDKRKERFVARVGGEPAGSLVLVLPQLEDREEAGVELCVHPAYRRRGIGRALYAYARDRLRELGRKVCLGYAVETLPGGPSRSIAGGRFAAAMGAKPAQEDVRRRLDLAAVDDAGLAALRDEAAGRATGYQVVSWRDRVPEPYAADAAYLDGGLVTDSPQGDRHREPPRMDVARLREREDSLAAAGRRVYSVGAVHVDSGRLVAMTDLALERTSPWHAWQWITLVEPRHRGRRLGALVKAENLRRVREHEPDLRVVDAWNAAANQPMIAVNDAMGFRPVDRWVNWQQDV
jgi:GNAT superfamily N-acetyltransferase